MAGKEAGQDLGNVPWDRAVTETVQPEDLPLIESASVPSLMELVTSLDDLEAKIHIVEELIWHGAAPKAAVLARELSKVDKRYSAWLVRYLSHLGEGEWGQKLLNNPVDKEWYS